MLLHNGDNDGEFEYDFFTINGKEDFGALIGHYGFGDRLTLLSNMIQYFERN